MTKQRVPTKLVQENGAVHRASPEIYGERPLVSSKKLGRRPTQDKILKFLARRPGSKIIEVAGEVGCKHQNASRQLQTMHKDDAVGRERDGRDVYYFLAHHTALHIRLHPHLKDERKRRVVEHLLDEPGKAWTLNELAQTCAVAFALVQRFLEVLKSRGLVTLEKRGFRYEVQGTTRLKETYEDYQVFYQSWKNDLLDEGEWDG